jgi:hypothetical protein
LLLLVMVFFRSVKDWRRRRPNTSALLQCPQHIPYLTHPPTPSLPTPLLPRLFLRKRNHTMPRIPHLHSLFTFGATNSSTSASKSSGVTSAVAFALFNISRSKANCQWVGSCRPVDARHESLVFEAAVGILLEHPESAAGIDKVEGVGFASSPASVIALSLLLFFHTPNRQHLPHP